MKNYFDHVKKAIWIVDKYYGFYDYEEWKQSKKEANYKINGKTIMLEADSEVYIQFVSGKTVSFSTNELAWIANGVEMPLWLGLIHGMMLLVTIVPNPEALITNVEWKPTNAGYEDMLMKKAGNIRKDKPYVLNVQKERIKRSFFSIHQDIL